VRGVDLGPPGDADVLTDEGREVSVRLSLPSQLIRMC
jgi:hypothetical protein